VRRLFPLVVILTLLFIGGLITTQLSGGNSSGIFPVIKQSNDPAASTATGEPWQARQLFLWAALILLSIMVLGTILALGMWFLDRQIVGVKTTATEGVRVTEVSSSS